MAYVPRGDFSKHGWRDPRIGNDEALEEVIIEIPGDISRVDIVSAIRGSRDFQFDIIMRSENTQVVLAALAPGESSSREMSTARESEQIIFAVEGEGLAKIAGSDHPIHGGCLLSIPRGSPHQVVNTGSRRLLYLGFFSPPVY